MRSSELKNAIAFFPEIQPYFRGIFAIDEISELRLREDEFAIINTEYVIYLNIFVGYRT